MSKMKIAFLIVFCTWLFLHLVLRPKQPKERFVVAHRGSPIIAPENTLAGIVGAAELGANYIELDIQRTKDGILILMHDKSVDRTTNGTGVISELNWEDLQTLKVGESETDQQEGEKIPDLNSVLEKIKDQPTTLVIEAKNPKIYPKIEEQLLTILHKQDMVGQVLIISFDHQWLEKLINLEPEVSVGYLYMWAGSIRDLRKAKVIDVHWSNIIFDPTLIYRSSNLGYQTVAWTVNNKSLMKLMLWLGVDGITTDRLDIWNSLTLGADT